MLYRSCILIPCYNEGIRLKGAEFISFVESHPDVDFCFVNDGSSDNTEEVLDQVISAAPDRLFLINCPLNRGKAEAIRIGMLKMCQLDYAFIGFMDADLATPLSEIERLLTPFRQKDYLELVMGSRIKRYGATIHRNPIRHYMGRGFATVVSVLFKIEAYDTQCGAKIFKNKDIDKLFSSSFISPWLFDVELLLRYQRDKKEICKIVAEEPLKEWIEQGDSRIKLSHLARIPYELFHIYRKYRRL